MGLRRGGMRIESSRGSPLILRIIVALFGIVFLFKLYQQYAFELRDVDSYQIVDPPLNEPDELTILKNPPSFEVKDEESSDQGICKDASSKEKPQCTINYFREYFRRVDQYPEAGNWVYHCEEHAEVYELSECKFESFNSYDCLRDFRIARMLFLGDSNARYHFHSTILLLRKDGAQCRKVAGETGHHQANRSIPDINYFARGNEHLRDRISVKARDCDSCRSEIYECEYAVTLRSNYTKPYAVLLEYAGISTLNDTSVTLRSAFGKSKYPSMTNFPQFLFNVYLKKNFPDIIFTFMPFAQEKYQYQSEEIMTRVKHFLNALYEVKPIDTRVFLMTSPAEVLNHQEVPGKWFKTLFQGLISNEEIVILNRAMFHEVKSLLLDPRYRSYSLHNLYNMSAPKFQQNVHRGVHTKGSGGYYFGEVMKDAFSTICNSKDTRSPLNSI